MIEYHNPRAKVNVEHFPYNLSITLTGSNKASVGLLANGFPDSVVFLEAVGRALEEELPGIRVRSYNKGNASIIASDDLVAGITKECKAVVTAYGH